MSDLIYETERGPSMAEMATLCSIRAEGSGCKVHWMLPQTEWCRATVVVVEPGDGANEVFAKMINSTGYLCYIQGLAHPNLLLPPKRRSIWDWFGRTK